jgi:hypothetical protein
MQLEFTIGKEIKYLAKTSLTKEELFFGTQKQKFKIPIKVKHFKYRKMLNIQTKSLPTLQAILLMLLVMK